MGIRILALISVLLATGELNASERSEPNIVLVMLDDSGWTDFGCYGGEIDTPQIDRFAEEGMLFTDCHSAASVCSPSRASILTGRNPNRLGMYSYRPHAGIHPMHLLDEEVTIAELLKAEGYRTGHFGKWHLSELMDETQPGPAAQGFEYSLATENNALPNHLNPVNYIRNGKTVGKIEGYSCQIVVNEAIEWLERIDAAANPFFACIWFHEPHRVIASPPELIEKYQKRFPKLTAQAAAYYANIENVDKATGRLLRYLKEVGVDEDTLVMITSDNGGLNEFSNQGLRGKKFDLWGGHRVPGILRWPGVISSGETIEEPICGIDFLPTVCGLTGIELPRNRAIDGANLADLLRGKGDRLNRQEPLLWFSYRMNPSFALREGRWVLIADSSDAERSKTHALAEEDMPFIKNSLPRNFSLYDLKSDRTQRNNLAEEYPEVVGRLSEKMLRLHTEIMSEAPYWKGFGKEKSRLKKVWNSY